MNTLQKIKKIYRIICNIEDEKYAEEKSDTRERNQEEYNNILKTYAKNVKWSNGIKNLLKIIFFVDIVILMASFVKLLWYHSASMKAVIESYDKNGKVPIEIIMESLTGMVASLTTVIVSVMKLPEIIAKYLFNPKDEESMISIVQNIQKYDTDMFSLQNIQSVDNKMIVSLKDKKPKQYAKEIPHEMGELENPKVELRNQKIKIDS